MSQYSKIYNVDFQDELWIIVDCKCWVIVCKQIFKWHIIWFIQCNLQVRQKIKNTWLSSVLLCPCLYILYLNFWFVTGIELELHYQEILSPQFSFLQKLFSVVVTVYTCENCHHLCLWRFVTVVTPLVLWSYSSAKKSSLFTLLFPTMWLFSLCLSVLI